jgi:hypothetical protein
MDEKRTHILDLPDEILLKISERVAMLKVEGKEEYPVEVGYFRLRHVCRRFRAVVKNKPHPNPLRESHEKEYILPLIEQIRAHDENWVEAWTLLRAQWLAKREAARERKRQNLEGDPILSSYSNSPPASGSGQGLGELRFRGHRPCPKCLEGGHLLRNCPNPPPVHLFTCCAYWGQHRLNCHARHCYVPESQNPLPLAEQSKPQTSYQQPKPQPQTTEPQSTVTETPFPPNLPPLRVPARMPPKLGAQPGQTLAALKVENPKELTEEFLKDMDPLLLKPEDFMQKWAEFFRELPVEGGTYEKMVKSKMQELKDCVVPQLLSAWLFALGHTCKLMRRKQGHNWQTVVKHYHGLIARILMSEAYSTFTMRSMEDRYFLEGLALWAGHDYSDPLGTEVCWFVDCYRKAVMRKHELGWTYQAWSAAVQRFLDGECVLRELAEISVASMQCRGLQHPLFAPQNLIDKIKRNSNGKEDLLHYVQSANPPKVRDFTRFMATDIATRVHPWPVQKDVDARLAPLQILDNWEKHKADVKAASPKPSPRNSPREPDESPVGSPRTKKAGKETLTVVEKEKVHVKEQIDKQLELRIRKREARRGSK